MSEITRKDIISDDALEAPLVLADNLLKVVESVNKIIDAGKRSEAAISSASTTSSIKKQTDQLTEAEKEVIKVQNQLSNALAKSNDEYIEYKRLVNDVNKSISDKIKYGNLNTKQISAENASLNQLKAALDKNRKAYSDLSSEQQRNSKEGKELLNIIQQQDKQYKAAKESMGQHQDSVGDYTKVMKGLKAELKAAQGEMAAIADTLGQSSPQYQEAAKRAGEIGDKLADAKDEAKAFQGDTAIENLGTRFGMLGDKIKNLDFEGAKNQINGIAQISKQMTFKEAINGAGGFGKAMLQLGKTLLTNPYFLLAAITVGIAIAIYKLKDSIKPLTIVFDALGAGLDFVVQKLKDFADWMGISSFAADEKAAKTVDNAKKETDAITKRYDREIKLAEAAGKSTIKLETDKLNALISNNNLAIKALEDKRARHKKLTDDEIKDLEEMKNANADFINDLKVLEIRAQKEREQKALEEENKRKERMLREQGDMFKLEQFKLQVAIKTQQDILASEEATDSKKKQAAIELAMLRSEMALLEKENALKAEGLTVSGKKLINEKYRNDLIQIDVQYFEELKKVDKEYATTEEENRKKALADAKKNAEEQLKAKISAMDVEVDAIMRTAIAGNISRAEAEKAITDVKKRYAVELVDVQIKALEDILEKERLTAEEKKDAEEKLADFRLQLTEETFNALGKSQIEKTAETLATIQGLYNEFAGAIGALFSSLSERRIVAIDAEIAKVQEQAELEMFHAGDNEARKKAIEEEAARRTEALEAKKRAIQRKQAILDKSIALVGAAMNTARAVTAALPNIPLSILVGALGAIQVAAIAAKPIPQFATGVENFEGGYAIVGEKGPELIRSGNQLSLSPGVPTLVNLPKGADVIPNDETMRMLALSSVRNGRDIDTENFMLYNKLSSLEDVIKEYDSKIVKAINNNGGHLMEQGGLLYRVITQEDGSKKRIRLKSFSS